VIASRKQLKRRAGSVNIIERAELFALYGQRQEGIERLDASRFFLRCSDLRELSFQPRFHWSVLDALIFSPLFIALPQVVGIDALSEWRNELQSSLWREWAIRRSGIKLRRDRSRL
jgi:hypothetical protein